jgi:hypothetical protein
MGATPTYLLPYPELTDPADVPLDAKELADRIEAVFVPGSANGQVPVWDNAAKKWTAAVPVGTELGYAEKTSSTNLTGVTTESVPSLIAALPSLTFDGATRILLELFSPTAQVAGAAGSACVCSFWDGNTGLGHAAYASTGTATALSTPMYSCRRLTPSAGAHVFSFRAWQQGANAVVLQGGTGVAGTYGPAFIRATKA